MINVVTGRINDGYFIEISGHAAENGNGVCAAVSALACSAAETLAHLTADGLAVCRGKGLTHGYLFLDYAPLCEKGKNCLETVFTMLQAGINGIEEKYPEEISAE